jgi:hypothetical protein
MIKEETFNAERIREFRKQREFSKIDVLILEKMIYALYLLELLKNEKIDFIFKGGSSLVLLFQQPKRFSIDVDILTKHSRAEIEKVLETICKNSRFTRYDLDKDRSYQKEGVPKAHYYLFFKSLIENKESQIMLDLLYDEYFYPKTIELPLKSDFLVLDAPFTKVVVPTINSISGDKITVFAPNTVGYLYKSGLEQQLIKQLFDLGFLFDQIDDFEEFGNSFDKKYERLEKYFGSKWTKEQIIDDVLNTSLLLSKDKRTLSEIELANSNELFAGIGQISNFLIKRPFNPDAAIESAAKTSLMAAKLKTKNFELIEPFDKEKGISSYIINDEKYIFLNRYRRTPSLALFYFNQMVKVLNG